MSRPTLFALRGIRTGLLTAGLLTPSALATAASLAEAWQQSQVNLSLRYRYEGVDQDGVPEDAQANTLRGRLSAVSGTVNNIQAVVEFDYVTELLDKDYNNTINGRSDYPVVADPNGADLNQAYLRYRFERGTTVALGRQRINHNNQRFVGGVAWRQNEQTFDGLRLQAPLGDSVALDYSVAHNVNRIFGERNANGDLDVDLHMLNLTYTPAQGHTLAAFAYNMDFEDAIGLSNRTLGVDYQGNYGLLGLHASYATQSDTADRPQDFSSDYYAVDVTLSHGGLFAIIGTEVLGSDQGVGFTTPLATLHKFQGFADKFLGTPGSGIEDVYLRVGAKIGGFGITATAHQFDADTGGADYGDELDLTVAYKVDKHLSLLLKYASYDANALATDTDKLWLQVVANY